MLVIQKCKMERISSPLSHLTCVYVLSLTHTHTYIQAQGVISGLKFEVSEAEEQLKRAEATGRERLRQSQAETESMKVQRDELEKRNRAYLEKLDQANTQSRALMEEKGRLSKEIADLQDVHSKTGKVMDGEVLRLKQQVKELDKVHSEVQHQRDTLHGRLQEGERLRAELAEEIARLQATVEKQKEDLRKNQEGYDKMLAQKQQLYDTLKEQNTLFHGFSASSSSAASSVPAKSTTASSASATVGPKAA